MKVVILAGGLGTRLAEETEVRPKPMVEIGGRPMLWHIMKWYASWGFDDFILCLGYKAEAVKQYFLDYNEALSNDFVLSNGGRDLQLLGSDISNWRITFCDTGAHSSIGERLLAVAHHLGDDPYFLATYGDGLTDAPLPEMIERLRSSGKTGQFLSVRPMQSLHVVAADEDGVVTSVEDMQQASVWINGGFFVFRREILDYVNPGEELVEEGFQRLIEMEELLAYRYEGFWEPMDTIKDKQRLDALAESGSAPWQVQIPIPMTGELT
jgi:glucose-1-phosphate cytidylyltransferase